MIASIILGLHLLGFIPLGEAASFLFVAGVLMILSETIFTSGIVAFNGILALYVGYTLKYGGAVLFGFPIDWSILFGISFIELIMVIITIVLVIRMRRHKNTIGTEAMVGLSAEIVEWKSTSGRVRVQGEIWRAESDTELSLKKNDKVTIADVDNLLLKIKAS